MKFEEALNAMLSGSPVGRETDYNHVRVYLVKGSIDLPPETIEQDADDVVSAMETPIQLRYFDAGDTGSITRLPRFDALDTEGNTVTGWLPTAADLFAIDWEILD